MGIYRHRHLLRRRQPTIVAGTLVPGVLPTIITMGHISSKNDQAVRKEKVKKGTVVPAWRKL
jgi:hypothetical protein